MNEPFNQNEASHIAIIGTGVSGLRVAQIIAKNSQKKIKSITLFEKNTLLGGVLNNTKQNGYVFEHGAQGVLLSREAFNDCLKELNISDKILLPNKREQRRYLLTPNSFVPLTPNIFKLLQSGLINFKDLFRIGFEFFIKKPKDLYLNESLYSFFERRFGKKFASVFLVSLTFGIWGGGARKLLIRYVFPKLIQLENGYGSLLKASLYLFLINIFSFKKKKDNLKGLASFREGMAYLIKHIYENLENECKKNNIDLVIKFNSSVNNIQKEYNKIKICSTSINSEYPTSSIFCSVIYTGQPWRDSNLNIEFNCEEGRNALKEIYSIESHSIAVVGLGGISQQKPPKGFGALAGEWSQDILGVIFIHSTYPAHAPNGTQFYRVMLGGDRDPLINQKSNKDLVSLAKQRLIDSKVITQETTFNFEHVVKWDNYIPLLTAHQDKVLESIWKIEALVQGLFFSGNYIKGASVSDCLEQAQITANKVLNYLGIKLKNK